MKRLISLTLAAALLAALALPAAAAEELTADARLARVTQAVKNVLDLDTDAYEDFSGGVSEDLVPSWDLTWSGENRSLSISALEDGTIVSLYRWESDPSPNQYWGSRFPTFPEAGGGSDRALAGDFLKRVLRPGETVNLEEQEAGASLDRSDGAWSGTIVLNGLPSPLHWSISVENGMIEHFSRDVPELAVVGGVPGPGASVEQAKAAEDLHKTLKLRLEYVLTKPGGTRAVLRYLPQSIHNFQVDAAAGGLLDVTALEEEMDKGYNTASGGAADSAAATPTATEGAADRNGLTQAELEGVQKLEGILSKEELDKALRTESAYGLRGYALTSAAYETRRDGGDGETRAVCSLRYARTDGGERLTRTITVDAKTGAVEGVWSSAPWGREKKVTENEALKKAEAFLKTWCPDRDLVLYESEQEVMPWRTEGRTDWRFTFAQEVNGLPFGSNDVTVGIDNLDGSVYYLSSHWDADVAFEDAEGVVSMKTALNAWAGTYKAVLAYRNVPQKLDKADPNQAKLMEQGMEYYYGLRLTYALEREESFAGVDAKTGEPIREERSNTRQALAYTDLAGSAAKADVEKLAGYGVGFAVDKFHPGKNITQWELVALIYSLQSPALDPEGAGEDVRDNAYFSAYRRGLLRLAERDDGAVLTRSQVVKMLLDAAGYGPAARLGGNIFTCGYTDKSSIPAEGLGYAAMAQALGMASGGYDGARTATRGEAASMLCRVLERTE